MENRSHKKSFVMLQEQSRSFALDKNKPIKGYLKLETGEQRGAVRVGVDNLRIFERNRYLYKLIFFGKKNEKTIYKILGDLIISDRGRGETYLKMNPEDVDGSGSSLELFTIAIVVAVSTEDSREPLHPVLKGNLERARERRGSKSSIVSREYNGYYNRYVLQCCQAIEEKQDLYDRVIPFKEDRTGAQWRRVVNLGRFPMVSPGAQYRISRYRHFIFGVTDAYYFIGVPGRYLEQEQPDQGESGFTLWQPIMGAEGYHADCEAATETDRQVAYGYWIAAICRNTGSISDPRTL